MITPEKETTWRNNLLLYLETCMVDHGGAFRWNKIGDDEIYLEEFNQEGLISFERLPSSLIEKHRYNLGPAGPFTHRLTYFSEKAWNLAVELRRARSERLFNKLNAQLLKSTPRQEEQQ